MGILTELVIPAEQAALRIWNDTNACRDAAIWRLPHPVRIQAVDIHRLFALQYAPLWRELAPLLESDAPFEEVMIWLSRQPLAAMLHEAQHELPGSINSGPARIQMASLRFIARRAPVFRVTDVLNDLLAGSDLGDVPTKFFRLPFPCCFVETGRDRNAALAAGLRMQAVDGVYPLEGAYLIEDHVTVRSDITVSSHTLRVYGLEEGEPVRVITAVVMGSPVGRSSLGDDMGYTNSFFIREQDEDLPLETILDRHATLYTQRDTGLGGDEIPAMIFDATKAAVLHIAKAVLYIGSKGARLDKVSDRSDADRRLLNLKAGKRAKLERRSARLYDHVVVGPSDLPPDMQEASALRAGVRPHWRRGHFHTVLFGPGRSERRLEFFMPTLVRQDLLAGDKVPQPRPYTIT